MRKTTGVRQSVHTTGVSEKEKSLWTNGIREGFVEKMKLGLKGWEGFIWI